MKLVELFEMAAAGNFRNRIWYHGTSKSAFAKIKKEKMVKANLADNEMPGEAIWLTSDFDEAKQYGDVVLAISNETASKYKLERWSGVPHGFKKKYSLGSPDSYNMVIKQDVPLDDWSLVTNKGLVQFKE